MRNVISVTAPVVLSLCGSPILQAQIYNHIAIEADTVTVTDTSIPRPACSASCPPEHDSDGW